MRKGLSQLTGKTLLLQIVYLIDQFTTMDAIIAANMAKIIEHLLGRNIDSPPKNFAFRGEQNYTGPAILIITLIDIWAKIAINPNRDIILIYNSNNTGLRKCCLIHNVAP